MAGSSLSKYKLVFDPTDSSKGDKLGSYLIGAGGGVITSTDNGGKESLDVNITNNLTIDADGVYNGASNLDPDNVGIIGHQRAASPADAQQTVRLTAGSPTADNVTPANVFGLDTNAFMMGYDSANTDYERLQSSNGRLYSDSRVQFMRDGVVTTVNEDTGTPANNIPLPVKLTSITGDINITANDLNVELSHSSDSVRIGDGTEFANVTTNNDLEVTDRANSAILATAVNVTDTSGALLVSEQTERKYIEIQNLDNKDDIEIGPSGVTFGAGFIIPAGGSWSGNVGPGIAIHAVADSGNTVACRILQLA